MRCFNLIGHAITADTQPRFWPGDEVDANTLASDEYQKVTSERMSRLRDYVESEDFPSEFATVIRIEYFPTTFIPLSILIIALSLIFSDAASRRYRDGAIRSNLTTTPTMSRPMTTPTKNMSL